MLKKPSENLLDRHQVLHSGSYAVERAFIGTERNTQIHSVEKYYYLKINQTNIFLQKQIIKLICFFFLNEKCNCQNQQLMIIKRRRKENLHSNEKMLVDLTQCNYSLSLPNQ